MEFLCRLFETGNKEAVLQQIVSPSMTQKNYHQAIPRQLQDTWELLTIQTKKTKILLARAIRRQKTVCQPVSGV